MTIPPDVLSQSEQVTLQVGMVSPGEFQDDLVLCVLVLFENVSHMLGLFSGWLAAYFDRVSFINSTFPGGA